MKTVAFLTPNIEQLLEPRNAPPATAGGSIQVGGADRDRTGDPLLAKQALSQLSYSPTKICNPAGSTESFHSTLRNLRIDKWWAWIDSNYRPHPYQGCALAT
jgi:hypothetical protein